jgi:hypothetical protein
LFFPYFYLLSTNLLPKCLRLRKKAVLSEG